MKCKRDKTLNVNKTALVTEGKHHELAQKQTINLLKSGTLNFD